MNLPELPPSYFWDQYTVKGRHGHALVTQLRKNVFWGFSRPVGDRKVEVLLNEVAAHRVGVQYPETTKWVDDVARDLSKKES